MYSGGAAPTYCVQVSATLGPPAHADIGLLISWQDMICNCLRSSISTYHAMELVWIALPARMEFGAVLSQQRLPVTFECRRRRPRTRWRTRRPPWSAPLAQLQTSSLMTSPPRLWPAAASDR